MREVVTPKGSRFLLCRLSQTDPDYPKYPPQPVVSGDGHFIERALSSIREFMEEDGQEFIYRRFIAPASASVRFAKALDRSVTGSMNDLIRHATAWLAEGDPSPHDVGIRLNDILLSALPGSKSVPYGRPRDAFRELVGSIES
jgi:hypothetical protein